MKLFYIIPMILLIGCQDNIIDNGTANELHVICGKVIDKSFKKGISEVKISIHPGNYFTVSDSLGYFTIKNIPMGKYLLTTESIYFISDSTQIDLINNDTLIVNISLQREYDFLHKFKLNLYEGYSSYEIIERPFIIAGLTTEKIFGCANVQIQTKYGVSSNNTVNIEYLRTTLDGVCLTAEGPAKANIPLKLSMGTYNLTIKQQDIIDKYKIIISDTSITVETNGTNYISESNYETYWRYPENSFVLIGGATQATQNLYYNFLEMLKDSIGITEITFPNYGTLCYPTSSQGHQINMPAKFYKYYNEGDFDKIGTLLKNYSKKYIPKDSGINIWLWDWKNKKYYSWILDN